MEAEKLKYPIGKFEYPSYVSKEILEKWITDIADFPKKIIQEVSLLKDEQLDTPYRAGGWTIRQVVHHCADSHLNSFIRIKLALTEDSPVIKPYFEERWAELRDSTKMPVRSSLQIIQGVHERWVTLLQNLTDQELNKMFIHPEHRKTFTIKETIGLYSWHCNHHLAHITQTKKRLNWQ